MYYLYILAMIMKVTERSADLPYHQADNVIIILDHLAVLDETTTLREAIETWFTERAFLSQHTFRWSGLTVRLVPAPRFVPLTHTRLVSTEPVTFITSVRGHRAELVGRSNLGNSIRDTRQGSTLLV